MRRCSLKGGQTTDDSFSQGSHASLSVRLEDLSIRSMVNPSPPLFALMFATAWACRLNIGE